ncbi:MAG: hypothetical protein RLZ86_301 [Actinomycetota bacterium]|jgi:putative (di)nucleoside polyphosphate hydrolase
MAAQSFRAGVVMIVRRDDGRVLACERADAPGSWQLPQGGLDTGEAPVEAAWRELAEETGLTATEARLVSELPEWIAYEWPSELDVGKFGKAVRGQVQKWFLFGVVDEAAVPVVDGREFRDWTWIDPHELVHAVIPWRREAYQRAFSRLLP